ncbi:hypothetical protein [Methylobacterium trifolii]|uniref:Photosystem reaction center subunit H n=1 Tax=Methylobacterium trifolii TaxID=1003092 RepID=A0ABQ4TSE9_9HYPH|nr:hypothetical protein [Methylobacterium trifolii]GJE57956.1 hypothetical protein MPOCJGCO_0032 [Methylobacterium trifolii]
MTKTILLAAGLLASLMGPLPAETPADADAAPPVEKTLDRSRNLAAKLAGLVGFANTSCDDVKGDPDLLKAAVQRLGVPPEDLDRGELYMVATSYIETYRKDVPANCKRALETFGASSAMVPNLIVKR